MHAKKKRKRVLSLPAPVELFDRTELIKKLLVDQPRHEEKLVVGHKLVDNLLLQALCLQKYRRKSEMIHRGQWGRKWNSLLARWCAPG